MICCTCKLAFLNKLSLLTVMWGFLKFDDIPWVLRHSSTSIHVSVVIFKLVIWEFFLYLYWCVCISVVGVSGQIERVMARMVPCVWLVVYWTFVFWEILCIEIYLLLDFMVLHDVLWSQLVPKLGYATCVCVKGDCVHVTPRFNPQS